jgi:hypothetical protein
MRESMSSQPTQEDCCRPAAYLRRASPSFLSWGSLKQQRREIPRFTGATLKSLMSLLAVVCLLCLNSCGPDPQPAAKSEPAAAAQPAEPAVPEDVQAAAESLLGKETTKVLLFGDLAKNGKQEFLAANIVPKTPKNENLAGTIITRAVVGEEDGGKWQEIFRCDEHLKNAKGFLGLTPLSPVAGWRIQYEQDPVRGLQLYFTPVASASDPHVLPIGVRWNPKVKRYQTMDRSYEQFLNESPTLTGTPKSTLR